ncbi:MAG: helix-turn-helix domain-containing protein [Clostridiales bacterium]|nr:helix-turn-helix domain-containing protein [Clostridiales bacterium]MDD7122203.1 helix-turn-helix domain-containing protein [Clostridiales bacterium]MDY5469723.1 helix-turn-helix domain-containing protein [Eubacteriales bacterium]
MFGENLKAMRKAKGYTQEELAIKINVVRQTVSKWEKGLSVPDADMLSQIAEVLDTKVSVLLGGTITEETDKDAVAEQLAKISEQLAIKNRRSKAIWKTIGMIVLAIMLLNILAITLFRINTSNEFDVNNSHSMIEIKGSAQNK